MSAVTRQITQSAGVPWYTDKPWAQELPVSRDWRSTRGGRENGYYRCAVSGDLGRGRRRGCVGEVGRALRLGRGGRVHRSQAGVVGVSVGPMMKYFKGSREEVLTAVLGADDAHLPEGLLSSTRCPNLDD